MMRLAIGTGRLGGSGTRSIMTREGAIMEEMGVAQKGDDGRHRCAEAEEMVVPYPRGMEEIN
jgi:hypothetical protein